MPVTVGKVDAMRTTLVLLLCTLASACGGTSSASDDDSTGTTIGTSEVGSSTGGPACVPGTEGCACDQGACEGELACFSEVCVMPPAPESSSSGGADTASRTDGGTSSTSDPEDTTRSAAESDSSTTVAEVQPCDQEGNHVCVDGVLDTCTDEEVVTQSCDDVCAEAGYFSTGCADINRCNCEGFADAACVNITAKFCSCYAFFGSPCDEAFEQQIYGYCFDPEIDEALHDLVVCYGDFPTDTLDQCNAAFDVCNQL